MARGLMRVWVAALALLTGGETSQLLGAPRTVALRFERALLAPAAEPSTASAFDASGMSLAVAGADGAVRIWRLDGGSAPPRVARAVSGPVNALAFAPDGELFGGTQAGIVSLTGVQPSSGARIVPGRVSAMAVGALNLAYAQPNSKQVEVVSRRDGSPLRRYAQHTTEILGLAFSPDGERLASGEFFRVARLWTLRCNCPQLTFPSDMAQIHHLSFSADGRWLLMASDSGLQVSDVTSGAMIMRFYPASGSFLAAAFAPDGSIRALVSDRRLALWRTDPLPAAPASARPTLHILAAGINRYRDPSLHLGFAEQDASDLAATLEKNAAALAYTPRVTRVLGDCATRTEILAALDQIAASAKPNDALLLFLAGHGREDGGEFWFYPHDFRRDRGTRADAVTSADLADRLARIAANRQIVLLDACQSGSATERMRRLLTRATAGRRVRTLSAAASNEAAMEVEELGHGLLTAALLETWKQAMSNRGRLAVSAWLANAAQRVSSLASEYNKGGSQRAERSSIGDDFEIASWSGRAPAESVPADARTVLETPADTPFSCYPTAADRRFVRPEGLTEMFGDLVFRCTGRANSPAISIQVWLNANFTGRPQADRRPETFLLTEIPGTRSDVATAQPIYGRLASTNSFRFEDVRVPGGGGLVDTQFRITGIRAAANMLGVSTTLTPAPVVAYYQVEAPGMTPLKQQQAIGFLNMPLTTRVAGCQPETPPRTRFDSYAGANPELVSGSSREGALDLVLQFNEGSPENFRPAAAKLRQRVFPEGFALTAESADSGTRLMAVINNIPAGVDLYATIGTVPAVSSSAARARMATTDVQGGGPFAASKIAATGRCQAVSLPMAKLNVANGMATAVWEVTSSDSNALDAFSFGLMLAYPGPSTATGGAARPGLGTTMVITSYAPISTVASQSQTAALPRFAATGMMKNLFTIERPASRLVIPDAINQLGFDTSVMIRVDSPETGPCSLSYVAGEFMKTPPPPQKTTGDVGKQEPLIFTLSNGGNYGIVQTPGARGCVLVTCSVRSISGEYYIHPQGGRAIQKQGKAIPVPDGADPGSVDPRCAIR